MSDKETVDAMAAGAILGAMIGGAEGAVAGALIALFLKEVGKSK
jgi:hypothetical protein